jgi:ABC-2 type transport system ATP-binding protein
VSGELDREVGISVRDAHKRYGVVPALQGLSLRVRAGEVCGLVGPNGAGKTSTLRALAGVIRVDAGDVRVCGRPTGPEHRETRRLVGVIPETPQLYEDLTALENLHFFARAHGLRPPRGQLGEALGRQGIAPLAGRVVATLSKGQKQRVSLACGLIHEPPVVLLDEPFSGLDVESREALRETIRSLAQDAKTVLVSSHDLSDVDALCSTVSVVMSGRVVADGPTGEVKAALVGNTFRLRVRPPLPDLEPLRQMVASLRSGPEPDTLVVTLRDAEQTGQVQRFFLDRGCSILSFQPLGLEEAVLKLAREEKQ